jgi:hypothetical protein
LAIVGGGWWINTIRKKTEPRVDWAAKAPFDAPSPVLAALPRAAIFEAYGEKPTPALKDAGKLVGLVLPSLTRYVGNAAEDVLKIATDKGIRTSRLQLELEVAAAKELLFALSDVARHVVWRITKVQFKTASGARDAVCDIPTQVLDTDLFRVELRDADA